jgi:hypothetical protein
VSTTQPRAWPGTPTRAPGATLSASSWPTGTSSTPSTHPRPAPATAAAPPPSPTAWREYDRLIGATREALLIAGRPYVIENVEDARPELVDPLTLCWTEFYQAGTVEDEDGTPLWMKRHRLFESNVHLWGAGGCTHPKDMQCAGAYGGARRDKVEARTIRHGGYVPRLPVMRELLGIDWMTEKGCQLSIPPAYTVHVGLGTCSRTSTLRRWRDEGRGQLHTGRAPVRSRYPRPQEPHPP